MRLEHEVVQDLYPLYIENDLSPSVKKAVEEHLKECETCRVFYSTGEKTVQINDMEDASVSKSLDEKIILKMKLNRVRLISVVLAGILFSMLFTDYINEREQLFRATDGYYDAIGQMDRLIDAVKNEEQINSGYEMDRLFEYNNELRDHLNFFEEYKTNATEFSLILNSQRLNDMLEVLKTRYNQGRWSKTDEAAFQALKEYFAEQEEIAENEYRKTHHAYSSYLHILNVKELDKFYENVNLLTYSYTRFHKMPDQIKPMNESKLKNRIAEALDFDKDKIKLKKESPVNDLFVYRFEIGNGYGGEIDAITGQITQYFGDTGPLTDGPVMDKSEVEKKARMYLEKIYGKTINFELTTLGFNYNYFSEDSRHKVYSFKAVPKVQDFMLYTPLETETIMHINARNGELESFNHNRYVPTFEQLNQVDLPAEIKNKDNTQNLIIYSALSGNFELVYMAPDEEDVDEEKFISVKTGKEDQVYVDVD
ncbi:zf-HC2 domain-containing protein [Bacillus sp. ISL-35]|uniref:zf-HC2 domain-containing protein n=1 Tax=Bacillus sp. ISL-35 TaxID=2819122 RepID=UPI001BEB3278|nr:zf-HC2 domain-containing protein [Bacillus sp. ISL-35]MBT2680104.1 zf-HC2 domain-containing protein [Bacillus sp. ISL-35]MBT2704378.1 zf-HC2 domain-containing protein [Chryseobacterium sp. ISL-80]